MAHYIDKDALVAEIERRLDELYDLLPDASKVENGSITTSEACNTGKYTALESFRRFLDTLEVKEVDLENYNKVKKLLSLSFMHFLDANRPEDKMCLSNGECFDIEKAFDELNFAKLFRYMEKYLKAQKGKEV